MEVSVTFTGLREMIDRLKRMPAEIQHEADEVIAEVSQVMAASVKRRYRRGPTGKLQRGVRVRKLAPMAHQVRSGAPHAHLYEFGTKVRTNKKGANRGSMPRFGPIFSVEKMRASHGFRAKLTQVLRDAGRGAGSPTGSGLL